MDNIIKVSSKAEKELLQIMAENDSEIIPESIFQAVIARHPLAQSS